MLLVLFLELSLFLFETAAFLLFGLLAGESLFFILWFLWGWSRFVISRLRLLSHLLLRFERWLRVDKVWVQVGHYGPSGSVLSKTLLAGLWFLRVRRRGVRARWRGTLIRGRGAAATAPTLVTGRGGAAFTLGVGSWNLLGSGLLSFLWGFFFGFFLGTRIKAAWLLGADTLTVLTWGNLGRSLTKLNIGVLVSKCLREINQRTFCCDFLLDLLEIFSGFNAIDLAVELTDLVLKLKEFAMQVIIL